MPTTAATTFTAPGFYDGNPITDDGTGNVFYVLPSDTSMIASYSAYIYASYAGVEIFSPQVTINIVCGPSATVTESTYPASLTDTQEIDVNNISG